MTPTIFQWIKESVDKRKKQKKEIDLSVNLSDQSNDLVNLSSVSYAENKPIRILDEGALTYLDGDVRLFFKLGSIDKFLESIPNDYVGYVNLGHLNIMEIPFNFGYWTKNDLSIVEIDEKGRKGLEVTPHMDERKMEILKSLWDKDVPFSVSSEVKCIYDKEESIRMGYPVVDQFFIAGFSLVGNPANTSSSDVSLSESLSEGDNMDLKKIKELLGLTELSSEEKEEEKETVEETTEVEETEETEEKETKEEGESEESETSEEETTETTEEKTEETLSEEDLEKLDLMFADYKKVKEENKQLKEELASLKSQETKLSSSVKGTLGKFEQLLNAQVKPEKKEKSSDCPDFL